MDHIGIDVHKTERQLSILGERGELREHWIYTIWRRLSSLAPRHPGQARRPR